MNDRLQRCHRHAHIGRVAGNAMVAGSENGEHSVAARNRWAAGSRLTFVTGHGDIAEVHTARSLQQVPGVADARIDLEKKTATVKFDPDLTSPAILTKATTDAGYPSTVHN